MCFCNEHKIPVLELPLNISYWSAIKYVLQKIFDFYIVKVIYSKMIQDEINHFLLDERYDEQIKEIFFKSLDTIIGNPVSLYDENFHCICFFIIKRCTFSSSTCNTTSKVIWKCPDIISTHLNIIHQYILSL